jgi:hypothetical protein
MNRAMILGIVGAISLLWGLYDLRKKDPAKPITNRFQSWAQIIAGALALLFSVLNLMK